MSETMHELISIRKKLETHSNRTKEEIVDYLQRLARIEITKKSIRSSGINSILRQMSKNLNSQFDGLVCKHANKIRENWKNQITRNKISGISKAEQKQEKNKKIYNDQIEKVKLVDSNIKPKLMIGEKTKIETNLEDDESLYNNEFFQYYEHLDNKKRKSCFTMLVKIFESWIDIITRVLRDKILLNQKPFSDQMEFSFSEFFYQIHKDELLNKNKK